MEAGALTAWQEGTPSPTRTHSQGGGAAPPGGPGRQSSALSRQEEAEQPGKAASAGDPQPPATLRVPSPCLPFVPGAGCARLPGEPSFQEPEGQRLFRTRWARGRRGTLGQLLLGGRADPPGHQEHSSSGPGAPPRTPRGEAGLLGPVPPAPPTPPHEAPQKGLWGDRGRAQGPHDSIGAGGQAPNPGPRGVPVLPGGARPEPPSQPSGCPVHPRVRSVDAEPVPAAAARPLLGGVPGILPAPSRSSGPAQPSLRTAPRPAAPW